MFLRGHRRGPPGSIASVTSRSGRRRRATVTWKSVEQLGGYSGEQRQRGRLGGVRSWLWGHVEGDDECF